MRKTEIKRLAEIIDEMACNLEGQWHEIMGVEIHGLAEANMEGLESGFDKAVQIEADFIEEHKDDLFEVSWPEHVAIARYNGDATYRLAEGADADAIRS